jgi:hypothetical protein
MNARKYNTRKDLKDFMSQNNTSMYKLAADLEIGDVYFYQVFSGATKSKKISD